MKIDLSIEGSTVGELIEGVEKVKRNLIEYQKKSSGEKMVNVSRREDKFIFKTRGKEKKGLESLFGVNKKIESNIPLAKNFRNNFSK
jgi:hypothetical protein